MDVLLRAGACLELPEEELALVTEARKGNLNITRAILNPELAGLSKIDRKVILRALSVAGKGGY
jgi:hypothetical protein